MNHVERFRALGVPLPEFPELTGDPNVDHIELHRFRLETVFAGYDLGMRAVLGKTLGAFLFKVLIREQTKPNTACVGYTRAVVSRWSTRIFRNLGLPPLNPRKARRGHRRGWRETKNETPGDGRIKLIHPDKTTGGHLV